MNTYHNACTTLRTKNGLLWWHEHNYDSETHAHKLKDVDHTRKKNDSGDTHAYKKINDVGTHTGNVNESPFTINK